MNATHLQSLVGEEIQDRHDASKWRTVLSIGDARPGRVWVLYADGVCEIEDTDVLADIADFALAA